MTNKITCRCPCGYDFETFSSREEAIAMVQLHVKRFHKDFLPFGITTDEALTFLKEEYEDAELKIVETSFSLDVDKSQGAQKSRHVTPKRKVREEDLTSFS